MQVYGCLNPHAYRPKDEKQAEAEWLEVCEKYLPLVEPSTIRRAIDGVDVAAASDGNILTIEKIREDVLSLAYGKGLSNFQRAIIQSHIWDHCRQDPEYWVDLFGYGFDWKNMRQEPFIMWETQRELLRALVDHIHGRCPCGFKDLVVDKRTRQEGGSYLCIFSALHTFLFYEKAQILFVSLEAKDVDGDPDSIFCKMDHILERMPRFLMPPGWNRNRNKAPFCRSLGYLRKPYRDLDTGFYQTASPMCAIFGSATTGNVGISQNATVLFVDEMGQIGDKAKPKGVDREIWESVANTTDARIANSTAGGHNTQHSILVRSAESDFPQCHVIKLMWQTNRNRKKGLRTFDKFPPEMKWDYRAGHHLLRERYYAEAKWDCLSDDEKQTWLKKWAAWEPNEEFDGKEFSEWYLDACCRQITDNESFAGVRKNLDGEATLAGSFVFPTYGIRKLRAELPEPLYKGRLDASENEDTGEVAIELAHGHGPITIFHEPKSLQRYLFTFDGAGGDGKDFSVGHVYDISTSPGPFEVAMFRDNQLGPTKQAEYIHYLLRLYNNALFVPEYQYGRTVIELLTHQYRYFKIYTRHDPTNIYDDLGDKYGYFTGPNKSALIQEFREHWIAGKIKLLSRETLDEMLHFIDHSEVLGKNDYGAEKGFHDDCVISAALVVPGLKYASGGKFRPLLPMIEKKSVKGKQKVTKTVGNFPNIGFKLTKTYYVRLPRDAEPADHYTAA